MYLYEVEKQGIFTEEGQREFLAVRDTVNILLDEAGAFLMCNAWKNISGDTWRMMAYVDRLVELGEIREVTGSNVAGQCRVFVRLI
jgi:hypothetical protein